VSPPKKVSQFVDKENDNLGDSPERFERSYVSHTAKPVSRKVMGKSNENMPRESLSPIKDNSMY
jgi:hypothetical protein